jgi:hypothetical protein
MHQAPPSQAMQRTARRSDASPPRNCSHDARAEPTTKAVRERVKRITIRLESTNSRGAVQ